MPLLSPKQRSAEWHAARLRRITSSVAAACLGMDPNKTAQAAWRAIVGRKTEAEERQSQDAAWGVEFEPVARRAYEITYGELVAETGFWIHPSQDWLGGSPDGLIDDDGVLEIKCPRALPESIPVQHDVQCRIHLAVTDRQWCDYFAWTHTGTFRVRLHRNHDYEEYLLRQLASWFDLYVVTDTCPPRRKRLPAAHEPIPLVDA